MEGLFFEGLPYHGKPTRVFAWLGLPKAITGVFQGLLLFSLLSRDTLINYRAAG